MLAKSLEKEKAIAMRREGYSMNEIAHILDVSKSSVSLWVRETRLSLEATRKIHDKRKEAYGRSAVTHRAQTMFRLRTAATSAEDIVKSVIFHPGHIQIMCALIYWCEGEKTKNDRTLTFANSDPDLVATFLSLLRRGFKIDETKFRICLHLHDYHEENRQVKRWSQITGIPPHQFLKSYRKPHTGTRKKEGYAGCASVRYYDVRIARQVQAIARAFLKKKGL